MDNDALLTKIESDIKAIEGHIDKFESEVLRLPIISFDHSPEYLNWRGEQFRKKSVEELSDILLELSQYEYYLTRRVNQYIALDNWIDSKIQQHSSEEIENISSSISWNDKSNVAKHRPPICQVLQNKSREVKMIIKRTGSLVFPLKSIFECIKSIKFEQMKKMENQHGKD